MTLDEAIKHSEEVAEKEENECKNCAKEHRQLANWLKELKQLREQEPCEDVMAIHTQGLDEGIRCAMCTNSMKSDSGCDGGCIVNEGMYKKVMETINNHIFSQPTSEDCVSREQALKELKESAEHHANDSREEVLLRRDRDIIRALPPVTPTRIETVTEFADRCRECGRTAITRAENDEILNEAWVLLMSVTEEDGVTTEEANGMLKLMNFFFYKYHGLKKKPEWVESVEARLANPMAKEYKMHPIKDGFPKTNSGRYLVQDTDGRIPLDKVKQTREKIQHFINVCDSDTVAGANMKSGLGIALLEVNKLIESEEK